MCVCVCLIGDHEDSSTVCGVLLHVQETRQDWPQWDADVRGGGAFGQQEHRGGDGPEGR